ncbi:3-deoxy-D-manno-octulosonic acid transferase [Thiosulfatimonas sediminis]|uniref:3-deoxy-D-manno-octulosonic acid transferase n=1 Tax=Thiosulfatimonas sediminis TaxID=2675054 RepID=A0A6F8PSG5_9GAMM|nr:3-deoxy-D-manno-octulosonic acid transferase [Thiosulfatimonas sediminis]BBP45073.1 3-deoxy-D-manno-octulosonic acid transferase [Thiosulfatimonas sediminis]
MRGFLYQTLIHLALPAVALLSWRKCRQAKRQNTHLPDCFAEKFGQIHSQQRNGILIHAVSLGETRSIQPLLSALQQRYPHLPITLTNGSVRGAKQLAGTLPKNIEHHFLPLDYPFAVNAFLAKLQPKLIFVVETEIWPNLIRSAAQHKIPMVMVNARLKASSMHAYRKFGGAWLTDCLDSLAWIGCQFPSDAAHFQQLGVNPNTLKLHGNLKFDLAIPPQLPKQAQQWRSANPDSRGKFIWVAASTHENEETLMLQAHSHLAPDSLLILVPRQADRFAEVERLLQQQKIAYVTRSSGKPIQPATQVYLADSVGEMLLWFTLADVAFVGGSLVPFGGHNILEPAALKTAVISGKWHHNLQALYDAMRAENGVVIVDCAEQLAKHLNVFASHPNRLAEQAERGYAAFQKHSGALQRLLDDLAALLD